MRYLLLLIVLAGCSSLNHMELVASKSYEMGCIDSGDNSPIYNYKCHMRAANFEKELHAVWVQQHQ